MNNFAILFDLDGTLVNSLPDICGALNMTRRDYGLLPLKDEFIRRFIGKGIEFLIANCLPEIGPHRFEAALIKYRELYLANPHSGGTLYSGVRETLETFRSFGTVKLGVATNKMTSVALKTLEYYLPAFEFDVVVGADGVSEKKPSPRHLLEPLARIAVPSSAAWFVGDDPVDLAAAKSAGVKFFAADYGFGGVRVESDEEKIHAFPELLEKLQEKLSA